MLEKGGCCEGVWLGDEKLIFNKQWPKGVTFTAVPSAHLETHSLTLSALKIQVHL